MKTQQLGAQRLPRAREPRFHRADRDTQREGNLVVVKTIHLAKDERRPLIEWQPIERLPDERGRFLAGQQSIREHVTLRFDVAELLQMLVEGHLARAMTTPPPALPVPGLIDDDPINPGSKGGLPAEAG